MAMKETSDTINDLAANDIDTESSGERRDLQSDADPLSDFVIIVKDFEPKKQNPFRIISESCNMSHLPKHFETTETGVVIYTTKLFIKGQYIATGEGTSLREAKEDAYAKALKILSQRCYTIKFRLRHETGQVMTDEVLGAEETPGEVQRMLPSEAVTLDTPIEDSSVGSKMLKMMGWSGGGLGKDGLGIAEPIKPSHVFGRRGLGFGVQDDAPRDDQQSGKKRSKVMKTNYSDFEKSIICLIQDFVNMSVEDDLVFSPEFTPDQRSRIAKLGEKFKLKVKCQGTGEDRYIVLSRRIEAKKLLDKLLHVRGKCDKYEVFPPGEAEY